MENEKPVSYLVWKTQEGYPVRLHHMSNEHLVNAITWLTTDENGLPSDLSDLYEGILLATWIREMTQELYRRIGAAA